MRRHWTRIAELGLAGVTREYPNKIAHLMLSADDGGTPRELHPSFYGCFDWHSAVHTHWALLRVWRLLPELPRAGEIAEVLDTHLSPPPLEVEHEYLSRRPGFECPYGLGWLLCLDQEIAACEGGPLARRAALWQGALEPLIATAQHQLSSYLKRLSCPIRTGEHGQTAFALTLALDWAHARKRTATHAALKSEALRLFESSRAAPQREPSGHDFLSPTLAEATVMGRSLQPEEFAAWLSGFWPELDQGCDWAAVSCPDPTDGRLAHLDGLNLSRAWMFARVAAALPRGDQRRALLGHAAQTHLRPGLQALDSDRYELSHWIGSFALLATDEHARGETG